VCPEPAAVVVFVTAGGRRNAIDAPDGTIPVVPPELEIVTEVLVPIVMLVIYAPVGIFVPRTCMPTVNQPRFGNVRVVPPEDVGALVGACAVLAR
jgi:hypothetical protein